MGFLAFDALVIGALYVVLRLIAKVWGKRKSHYDHGDTLAPEVEASPRYLTILTLNNHIIEIGE